MHPLFIDRRAAGRALAGRLANEAGPDVLVLGLPRGGVPVAAEVAEALGAELDVLVARKIGAPGQPEYGLGAIAPGVRVLDYAAMAELDLEEGDLAQVERQERAELARREAAYRGDRPAPRIRGRTVVVVDDGLATGVTAKAALRSVRAHGPKRLVFAAPVGPVAAARELASECDEVVLVATPRPFDSVGLWYRDFDAVRDDEVLADLVSPLPSRNGAVRI